MYEHEVLGSQYPFTHSGKISSLHDQAEPFFAFCSSYCPTILNKIVELESGITMLNDIVDNNEHCDWQNIV